MQVADNQWHHVVASRNGSTGKMYLIVDGSPSAATGPTGSLAAAEHITLGERQGCCGYFRGSIDFLTFYEVPLSIRTAEDLYARKLPSDLGFGYNPTQCMLTAASSGTAGLFPRALLGLEHLEDRGVGPITPEPASLKLKIDADAPTSTIELENFLYLQVPSPDAPGSGYETFIIGGSASDGEGAGIDFVDVSVNSGAPGRATGMETWMYPLALNEGAFTVQSFAQDRMGHREAWGPIVTLFGDGTPPETAVNLPQEPVIASRSTRGLWRVPLNAFVNDPGIDGYSGSGTASVELHLQTEDGYDLGWQEAEIVFTAQSGNAPEQTTWSVDYEIPLTQGDPTGSYTVTVRASDRVGNETEMVGGTLEVITVDMAATMTSEDPRIITEEVTISGVISSTTGIASLEASYAPIDSILVISDTIMHLPFDETPGAVFYADSTKEQSNAYCAYAPDCPIAGETGVVDRALRFTGNETLEVFNTPSIAALGSESVTMQAWIKTGVTNGLIMSKVGSEGNFVLWLDDFGILNFDLYDHDGNATTVKGNGSLTNDEWYHVAAVVDRSIGEAVLYVNGNEYGYEGFDGDFSNDGILEIGIGFGGLMDNVIISKGVLNIPEIRAQIELAQQTRQPVNLTPTGDNTAIWQLTVSDAIEMGREGFHQIDLHAVDSRRQSPPPQQCLARDDRYAAATHHHRR